MTPAPRPKPLVLGLGDSWFDYFALDIFDRLEEVPGLEVKSLARAGTRLQQILHDPAQLLELDDLLRQHRWPAAILLSIGGNDVVNDDLARLLLQARSPLGPVRWDRAARRDRVQVQMAGQLRELLDTLIRLIDRYPGQPPVPLLLHGYDHPHPDGRGPLGHPWEAWLEPAFAQQGYAFGPATSEAMRGLIDELNTMQQRVLKRYAGRVHHVDLRGTLHRQPPAHRRDWGNELHPTQAGFEKMAKRMLAALRRVRVKPLPSPLRRG